MRKIKDSSLCANHFLNLFPLVSKAVGFSYLKDIDRLSTCTQKALFKKYVNRFQLGLFTINAKKLLSHQTDNIVGSPQQHSYSIATYMKMALPNLNRDIQSMFFDASEKVNESIETINKLPIDELASFIDSIDSIVSNKTDSLKNEISNHIALEKQIHKLFGISSNHNTISLITGQRKSYIDELASELSIKPKTGRPNIQWVNDGSNKYLVSSFIKTNLIEYRGRNGDLYIKCHEETGCTIECFNYILNCVIKNPNIDPELYSLIISDGQYLTRIFKK